MAIVLIAYNNSACDRSRTRGTRLRSQAIMMQRSRYGRSRRHAWFLVLLVAFAFCVLLQPTLAAAAKKKKKKKVGKKKAKAKAKSAKSAKKKKGKKAKKKAPKRKLTAEEAEVAHAAKLGVPKNLQKAFGMLRCTACERMMEKHKKTLARMLNKKARWNDKTQASKTMKPVAIPRNT